MKVHEDCYPFLMLWGFIWDHTHINCEEEDATRVQNANRRSLENTREARVARRQLKFIAAAATKTKEGVIYGPGIGD